MYEPINHESYEVDQEKTQSESESESKEYYKPKVSI